MHIQKITLKKFPALPKVYKKPDGGTVSNFNKLSDAELISRFEIYPVTGEPELTQWQQKSDPVYTFTETHAEVSYTITNMLLADRKQSMIAQVYSKAAGLIDQQAKGYSSVEVATWPKLRAEVRQYNLDQTIGDEMAAVIAQGLHSAGTLAALLTPKADFYDAVLENRNALVLAIHNVEDENAADIDLIDINAGWPE